MTKVYHRKSSPVFISIAVIAVINVTHIARLNKEATEKVDLLNKMACKFRCEKKTINDQQIYIKRY